jgi:hypothetical protein
MYHTSKLHMHHAPCTLHYARRNWCKNKRSCSSGALFLCNMRHWYTQSHTSTHTHTTHCGCHIANPNPNPQSPILITEHNNTTNRQSYTICDHGCDDKIPKNIKNADNFLFSLKVPVISLISYKPQACALGAWRT